MPLELISEIQMKADSSKCKDGDNGSAGKNHNQFQNAHSHLLSRMLDRALGSQSSSKKMGGIRQFGKLIVAKSSIAIPYCDNVSG